jgi:hypothetical protein
MTAKESFAQNRPANIWASVNFNKQEVVAGEPLLVTISVYTSTWFTAPPQYGEIQVPEAMMVEYQQRTGSLRKTIGNRSYPAVEKKYVVYPFREGENRLPALSIQVESPPEGDYRGKRRVVRSPERSFTVLPPPEGIATDKWLTAYQVDLSEQWDRPLDQLKQGDVLERQITIRTEGALAALIPPMQADTGSFGKVYPRAARLSNVQNQSSFTGTRVERWTYLLENEGSHNIPGIELSWYDPGSGQLKQATLGEKEITVNANPNLEFLLSMQDSLQAMLEIGEDVSEKEPFRWMGLNWWQWLVALLSAGILVYFHVLILRRVRSSLREKKIRTKESEERYFENLKKQAHGNPDPAELMRALISWYDRYRVDRYGPELEQFVCAWGDPGLKQALEKLEGIVYGGAERGDWNPKEMLMLLGEARKRAAARHAPPRNETLAPLNPAEQEAITCKDVRN